MVILMVQYNLRPGKAAEYAAWAEAKVPVALSVPGDRNLCFRPRCVLGGFAGTKVVLNH